MWVVGMLSLMWNAMGAFDYVMTQTRNEAYMSSFLSNGLAVVGDAFSLGFTALIFVVALALFLYARALRKRNILA